METSYAKGPQRFGPQLGVSAGGVANLRRPNVAHLSGSHTSLGEVIRSSKTTAVSYERDRPRELVHIDDKEVDSVHRDGWRDPKTPPLVRLTRTRPASWLRPRPRRRRRPQLSTGKPVDSSSK